jgi:hypothetical protein
MNDLEKYIKDNNKLMLKHFNFFLKKFALIKLLSDYNNNNEEIINSFNELTIENLFSILELESLYEILPKNNNNEINFIDIAKYLPKIFNENEIFLKLFGQYLNHKNVLDLIVGNVQNFKNKEIFCEKELIIQFSPIKFDFVSLDKNIFDWIEKSLGKKCKECNRFSKESYICLICGSKICSILHLSNHAKKCGGYNGIFINMNNMKIILWNNNNIEKYFPIYVNKSGNGPQGHEIGNEFKLSHEKIKLAIKNYLCNDF